MLRKKHSEMPILDCKIILYTKEETSGQNNYSININNYTNNDNL